MLCTIKLATKIEQLSSAHSDQSPTESELGTLVTLLRMDPEPEHSPEHDPMEAPSPVPQPMMMERSLSTESGSNSSVSTVYLRKVSKAGSAASSRSGSVASTSRSPPHEKVPDRSSPSFSFGQDHLGETPYKDLDDQPPFTTLVVPSSEEEKPSFEEENKDESSIETTKEDIARAFPQGKVSPTKTIEALKKGSDQIVSEVARTETIILKEAEEAVVDECCTCCRSCATWGLAGDVAAILCCPFTVISLLSCMCCRCPKMFATKTAEKVKNIRSATKGEQPQANKEESEFEQSTGNGRRGSQAPASTVKHIHSAGHREEKPAVTAQTKSRSPGSSSEKLKSVAAEVDAQRNYFFPRPGVEDDHPGGDQPGGR